MELKKSGEGTATSSDGRLSKECVGPGYELRFDDHDPRAAGNPANLPETWAARNGNDW